MAKWTVTEELFKSWIDWKQMVRASKCKVGPRSGRHSSTSDHENCSSCPGNYYHGGECNYGGHHVLAEEVARINKNFDGLDTLIKKHNKLKCSLNQDQETFKKEKEALLKAFDTAKNQCSDINAFIYGCCVGIDEKKPVFLEESKKRFENAVKAINGYIASVRNLTQQQMQDFETKLKKVEDLKEEISKLKEALKNTNDPAEKTKLLDAISTKQGELKKISQELTIHPAKGFWDQQSINLFKNIRQYLGTGDYPDNQGLPGSKGKGKRKGGDKSDDPNDLNQNQEQQKQGGAWFTPEVKEACKMIGGGILVLVGLWLIYKFLASKLNSE